MADTLRYALIMLAAGIGIPVLAALNAQLGARIGSPAAAASVLFVVVRDLATRRLSRDVSSVTVAFLAALAVALVGAAVVPFTGWQSVTPHQWALIAMASVFLIVGYLCVVMAMRVGEIAFVAPFRYTALVAALALGWLVFGELPDALTLAGAAVIVLTGIYTFHRERAAGVRDPVALARPLPRTPS